MCNESAIKILHTFVLILGKFSPAAKKAAGPGGDGAMECHDGAAEAQDVHGQSPQIVSAPKVAL